MLRQCRVAADRAYPRVEMALLRPQRHHVQVPSRQLRVQPCRGECAWGETPARHGRSVEDVRVFACRACGTQWVRSLAWTPIDADGTMPDEVRREASRRGSGVTIEPDAGGAGSGDR
jgi:hypothetical protein